MTRLTTPITLKLEDSGAEQVRRNHDRCIRELQELMIVQSDLIEGVVLANATLTEIPHKLGRPARMIIVSPPRGAVTAGLIADDSRGGVDRSRAIRLIASGHGATITVDVLVF